MLRDCEAGRWWDDGLYTGSGVREVGRKETLKKLRYIHDAYKNVYYSEMKFLSYFFCSPPYAARHPPSYLFFIEKFQEEKKMKRKIHQTKWLFVRFDSRCERSEWNEMDNITHIEMSFFLFPLVASLAPSFSSSSSSSAHRIASQQHQQHNFFVDCMLWL